MQLIAYHLQEWSEIIIEWKPLFCPAWELPLVTCSLCCLLNHLGLHEDFSSCQRMEWKKCCVLWQEARCCRTTSQSFLTSYKDDSTKLSTLEESMNFFSHKLMALQQPSKSALLHRSVPLFFSLAPTADHYSSRTMLSIKQSGIYLLSQHFHSPVCYNNIFFRLNCRQES